MKMNLMTVNLFGQTCDLLRFRFAFLAHVAAVSNQSSAQLTQWVMIARYMNIEYRMIQTTLLYYDIEPYLTLIGICLLFYIHCFGFLSGNFHTFSIIII